MIILQGQQLARHFGSDVLFENLDIEIQNKSRIGLVGPNGAGKSTLLKMITGQEEPSLGHISMPKNIEIGYIAQEHNFDTNETIWDEMLQVFTPLIEVGNKMTAIQEQLAQQEKPDEELLKRYDQMQYDYQINGGFTYETDIKTVLNGFKFDESTYHQKISTLSGGEKTRLGFVKLLLKKPDLLVLDEPTNHLDVDTLTWLETFLKNYSGAILAVSHDQYFLDAIATEIYELSFKKLTHFTGNYSKYVEQRELMDRQNQEAYEKQQAEIKKQEDFIQKNIVRASTTKRAQSRRKQLDKMERIQPPKHQSQMNMKFNVEKQSGKEALLINHMSVGYEKNDPMIQDVNLQVNKHNRVAILGANGIGKSTLLKTLVKQLEPLAGSYKFGANVSVGFYDQEISQFNSKETVIDTVWNRHRLTPEKEIRSVLASFLFGADDIEKSVGQLSGGQRARLALTVLSMENHNFLIMDEPTNHLDIDAKEVLEKALREFDGTLVFVSHDRYFINELATTTIEVKNNQAYVFDGNYDYYLEKKEQIIKPTDEQIQQAQAKSSNTGGKEDYAMQKKRQAEIRKIERGIAQAEENIEKYESQIEAIQEQMTQPKYATDYSKMAEFQSEINLINEKLSIENDNWEYWLTQQEETE